MELLIFCILIWACFGGLSVWIASQKGRSAGEGFVLGFAFGPLGVIVESLLPNGDDALGPRKAGVSS